jgi:uncharacterized coiled-coil DUF342 family protein
MTDTVRVKKKLEKKKRPKRDSLDTLYRKRDRALERVFALWKKKQDVNNALDVLTLAHTALTFKFLTG